MSYKRLEEGRLISNWDAVTTREMDWTQLKLLLEGIESKLKNPTSGDESTLFFDESKVPVEVIEVPNPEAEGLDAEVAR